jgi:kynurenine formamidase
MDYDDYIAALVAEDRFGPGDLLGTANLIDGAARRRAAQSVRTGQCLSLARPLVDVPMPGEDHVFSLEVFRNEGPIGFATDRVELRCHGLVNTHLDALNHIELDGGFYRGFAMGDERLSSMADLARHGLVTRGVVVDVPAARGREWVTVEESVSGEDIDRALGSTTFEPGDALLLYMGRDRFEAAGSSGAAEHRPGVGRSGAEWIADHGVSIVCWDFLDATVAEEPSLCVHRLIRAIGLLLVDNCDLAGAAAAARQSGEKTGALAVAPIGIPGGTGCNVTPLFII